MTDTRLDSLLGPEEIVSRTGAAPPEYVGHVESYSDVPVGGYGIVGDTLFVALVYDADINGYFTDGIKYQGYLMTPVNC